MFKFIVDTNQLKDDVILYLGGKLNKQQPANVIFIL